MTGEDTDTLELEKSDRGLVLRPLGRVDLVRHSAAWVAMRDRIEDSFARGGEPFELVVDLARAELDDGMLALLLALKRKVEAEGHRVEVKGASATASRMLAMHAKRAFRADQKSAVVGWSQAPITSLGRAIVEWLRGWRGAVDYLGEMSLAGISSLAHPLRLNWRDVPRLIAQIGADALPIVLTINFLVGMTIAYMGAIQLKQFGANIFVADMVAIAVVRSLGPLMTGIIVAGRSGAGIAAELGTMKVSEEIDALRVLGLEPMRFLVLPRILAMVISLPLLTLAGEVAAILGGMFVGITSFGLTSAVYIDRTHEILSLRHVGSGLVKCMSFAIAIVLIACHRGLATDGGAEGVGRSTTTSVVQIIFQIVVLESFFTVIFNLYEI